MGTATPWISLSLIAAAGCGAGFRHERVGTIRTTVGQVGQQEPTLAAVPIAHPSDRHRLDVAFYLPRAAEVRYTIDCPGQSFEGLVGESWEHYRQRRLRELERERQRDIDTVGALTGALVGSARAKARVETPNAEAEVSAEVDGAAVGRAVADSSIPQVQLDPRDVGAQSHKRKFELVPGEKGQCTVSIWSETDGKQIQGVTADLTVTRIVDIAAERATANARSNQIALDVRGEITASLVATGADPGKRERERREREAEAYRTQQAELALRRHEQQQEREAHWREQQVAVEYQDNIRTGAYRVRGRIVGELISSGCDPHKRLREREEQARLVREEREHGARIRRGGFGIRAHIVDLLIAGGADPDYRRKQNEAELRAFEATAGRRRREQLALELQFHAALRIRETIRLSLIATGAVDRPAPAPVVIETPERVEVEANVAAEAAIWVPPIEIVVEGVKVLRPGSWRHKKTGRRVKVRDHRKRKRVEVRDHR